MLYPTSVRRLAGLAAVVVFLTGCSPDSGSAQVSVTADDTPVVATADSERAQRILKNIQFEIPQLREIPVIMGDIQDGAVAGLDRGSFMVQGQTYQFLVTEDDAQLFLLAAPPIDVSRTEGDLEAARREEAEAAARADAERANALAEASADLPSLGPADAPVTIVEFSDFQCPFCKRAQPTVKELLERYPTQVRLAYAHYPLPNHPWARPAAIAAECAAAQDPGLFWTLHDAYFENQAAMNPSNVADKTREFLAGSGIDLATWNTCATDTASEGYQLASAIVDRTAALGRQMQVSGTPAFFINGQLISGARPIDDFVQAVEAALAE